MFYFKVESVSLKQKGQRIDTVAECQQGLAPVTQ